jgi:hypothetical protein
MADPAVDPATDPEIRDFQIQASRDGGQPIALPFAFITSSDPPTITYARIEGVSKYVRFLGILPNALD